MAEQIDTIFTPKPTQKPEMFLFVCFFVLCRLPDFLIYQICLNLLSLSKFNMLTELW